MTALPCRALTLVCVAATLAQAVTGSAQTASFGSTASTPKPRPTGRVAVYSGNWMLTPNDGPGSTFREVITQVTFNAPETEADGLDYGLNLRHAGLTGGVRPDRLSLYEAFAGARVGGGRVRLRGGHVWLNDLGALGSLAGGVAEFRQAPGTETASPVGRLRVGGFAGLEPKVFESGYFDGVRKYGAYAAIDGTDGRRHSVGYVRVLDRTVTERSVLTTMNFVPVKRVFYLYQGAEYDLQQPAGRARAGLSYFYANARANTGARVQLQGTYNRGRSVDTRGLADDVLSGRPISQAAAQGLSYESIGGRVTVTPVSRLSLYAGRYQDRSNRDDKPSDRTTVGGNAMNIGRTGLDVSGSLTRTHRSGGTYRSDYVSVGRQVGRSVYLTGDYTTSLSIVQFSRGDGLLIEERPTTKRLSLTGSINVGPATMLQVTMDRTWDSSYRDLRFLSGIAYRFR